MCPGTLLQNLTKGLSPSTPFFTVAQKSLFPDYDAAMDTVHKIQELDAAESVFVVMAHDRSLRDQIPLFPDSVNAWTQNGLRARTPWLLCSDFETA